MKTQTIINKILNSCKSAVITVIALIVLATQTTAVATVRTWSGGGTPNFNWSVGANWGGTAPVSGDQLVFAGSVGLSNTNDLVGTTATNLAAISFAAGAGQFVLEGGGITISAGVTNNSSVLQTFDIDVQNNTTVAYNTAGANIKNTMRLWNNKCSVKGGHSLIMAQTTSGYNGQIFSITNATVILCATNGGPIGHGVQIDSNGVLVVCGPAQQFNTDYRADVTMSNNALFQVQCTNYAGAPDIQQICMLRSPIYSTVVENGSALNPVQLQVGLGSAARVGAFDGTIRDGLGGGKLGLMLRNSSTYTYWRLGGTNSYTGDTVVTNNINGNYTRLLINGSHTGGGNYTVAGNASTAKSVLGGSGFINAGTVNVNGNGIIAPGGTLSGANLYIHTGGGSVNDGTFAESTGILTITNNVSLNVAASSTLDVHLNGTTPGTGHDQLVVEGSGIFTNNNANLQVTLDVGYNPNNGDKFTIVKVPGTSGANNVGIFSTLNGVATDLSQGATITVGASQFQISYRADGSTFDAGAGNGNDIMLQALVSNAHNLTWRGDVNADWDIQTTANWRSNSMPAVALTFTNLDNVTFDDTGVTTNVNLADSLNPATVLVNAAQNYFFSTTGSGKLTGGLLITKTNSGTLTLLTANDNTGGAIINQGTLQIGANGVDGALNCALVVNSNGVLAFNHADDQIFSPAAFSGTGKLVHNGSGQLTITNDYSSTFTGVTTNSGGLLKIGNNGTTGGNFGRLGGLIYIGTSSALQYNFASSSQTIASSLAGPGSAAFGYGSGSQTILFGSTATNSGFTGTTTVNPFTRVEVTTAAATVAGPIIVQDDGTGGYGAYYTHVSNFTNQNAITISGRGTTAVDNPRGKGALRLGNGWAGSITLSGSATIGASTGTGTILGNISDGGNGYTVEYFGGTLQVGPTSGVNSYGTTVITEDLIGSSPGTSAQTTVRALNGNLFGSGAVQMVGQTRLELNGNNVSIANLADNSPSSAVANFQPVVVNNSSATTATLTLGSDNGSQTFSGIFGDGNSKAFGLTKVGSGTFTVTGDNTNTGPVTVGAGTLALVAASGTYPNSQPLVGSGSFSNANTIAVNSSATLDVTGRGDTTLTLNSGQTLKGSGTITGNVIANANSTINPGDTIGALTVSGNLTLAGKVLMELNRANTPATNDEMIVSGTITAGGTLTVTNLGPALHAGDSFNLFSAGVTGSFTATNLQTIDLANNVQYTWNNTIGTDGKVSVASVSSLVNTNPPQVQVSVAGNILSLGWPTNAGWTLLTNGVGLTAINQWFPYPNSANLTNVSITMDTSKTNVFFRMAYPYP